MASQDADVIVVGAGLSGLAAARSLSRAGRSVIVLEASKRLGGRILTRRISAESVVDLGAQWIGPGQERIHALAEEFGLATHTTRTKGKTAFEFDGLVGASRIGFPLSRLSALWSIAKAMRRIEIDARKLCASPPWNETSSDAVELRLDEASLADFLERHAASGSARTVMRSAIEGIFCRAPEEISLNLALYAIFSSGSFSHMQGVKGGAQERQLTLGAGALIDRLLAGREKSVHFDSAVTSLEQEPDGVIVSVGEASYRASRVVLAIPPTFVSRLSMSPELPPERGRVLAAARMGSVFKVALVYPTRFWNDRRLSGAIWSTSGPWNVCYDTTPLDVRSGLLSVLAVASCADKLGSRPADERRRLILDALARHLGPEALEPTHYIEHAWNDEPYVGGGYSITLPPGSFSRGPEILRTPHGRVHFAGTETARRYPGYMEGALESAERVVEEILTGQ